MLQICYLLPKCVKTEIRTMNAKTLTKSLVTVHTVRAANGRIMSSHIGALSAPAKTSVIVGSKIRDVSAAGQFAMQQYGKKK